MTVTAVAATMAGRMGRMVAADLFQCVEKVEADLVERPVGGHKCSHRHTTHITTTTTTSNSSFSCVCPSFTRCSRRRRRRPTAHRRFVPSHAFLHASPHLSYSHVEISVRGLFVPVNGLIGQRKGLNTNTHQVIEEEHACAYLKTPNLTNYLS